MAWRAALAGTVVALAVGHAQAQPAPPPPSTTVEGVTVVAPTVEQEKLPDLVNRFVQGHGAASRIDQLSRWAGRCARRPAA